MARAILFFAYAGSVFAHAGERGLVLLLPTGMYMLGGAAAVVLSFAVLALLPSPFFSRLIESKVIDTAKPRSLAPSAVMLLLLGILVFAGYTGSRDPLENP